VGGANGANRLSGNALTEAFTFGRRAGLRAAALAETTAMPEIKRPSALSGAGCSAFNPAAEIASLQALMNQHVGPLRRHSGLITALQKIEELRAACAELPAPKAGLDPEWIDLHDLRNMQLVAECVTRAALARIESRGAHQRDDFPETSEGWQKHQKLRLAAQGLRLEG
jgi:succinate dehydrogenase/fumarate reductase flavoprotein subunit